MVCALLLVVLVGGCASIADEPQTLEPTPSSSVEQPTFAACDREAADPSSTNLRPSVLSAAELAIVAAWDDGWAPDGQLVVEHATDLLLPAGQIGFGNGYEASTGWVESQRVAPDGTTAPVSLAVLDSPSSGRRVAFVEVRVSPAPPVRWDEVPDLGFVTDGGDGGVLALPSGEPPFVEDQAAFDAIEAMYPGGDSASGTVCVLRSVGAVVTGVQFSAGWGDGGYPTFLGYDDTDRVVSAVSYGAVLPWSLSGLPGVPPEGIDGVG
ncbi:hypothetical protein Cch01nite_19760 [Cellulomonas chitinilytica]|uniref:DUF4241 domain-containing protein n=1 Tax=Cellulomonas chitinilytica TaxID=398759 RepID=A0A919P0Z6_9CELL|nr:hypothetical protein Cch01nite_19760 [Cellulomonas chitinilytica]